MLARALTRAAVDPKAPPQPVPYDFALWQLGIRMGIPPWTFEGYPPGDPPVEWVIRSLEFGRMTAGGNTKAKPKGDPNRRTY